jgi:hypothetical protein
MMMRGSLLVLVLVLAVSTLAAPALPHSVSGPTANAGEARAPKACSPGPHERAGLVRLLDFIEHKVGQFTAPRDGFSVRLDGIASGSDLAARAARIVANFAREAIAAMVAANAQCSDPRATNEITGGLMRRRELTLCKWLPTVSQATEGEETHELVHPRKV